MEENLKDLFISTVDPYYRQIIQIKVIQKKN